MFTLRLKSIRSHAPVFACVLMLAIGAACSDSDDDDSDDSGDDSDNPATAFVNNDVFVHDDAVDNLLSFSVTIADLRFEEFGIGTTANLLAGPVSVDFLSLQSTRAWLASLDLEPGTYSGMRMEFVADSAIARRKDGATVDVDMTSTLLDTDFSALFTVDPDDYRRFEIDLDLENSLEGDVLVGPLVFTPVGSVTHDDGGTAHPTDDVRGIVRSFSEDDDWVAIDAFVDDNQTVPLGPITIRIDGSTLLLRDGGDEFSSEGDFFDDLELNITTLEVRGEVENGMLEADRVEIEDNTAGGGPENLVKLEGLIIGEGPGSSITIAVGEVEKGGNVVSAAFLGTLPATLIVGYDSDTVFIANDDELTESEDLAVGQKIKVKFPSFANPPFIASKIVIEDDPEFEARIVDIDALPDAFVVHMDPFEAALTSGLVASTVTDVDVDITDSALTLDTPGAPVLDEDQLLTGLQVELEGQITGPPSAPIFTADHATVHAGRLSGALVLVARPDGNPEDEAVLTTSGGVIKEPFGAGVVPGPMLIDIDPEAVFGGLVTSEANFFILFNNLSQGQALEVDVKGIGAGEPNRIRAYYIKTAIIEL